MKTLIDAFVVPPTDLRGMNLELLFGEHFPGVKVNIDVEVAAFLGCSTAGNMEPFACKVYRVASSQEDEKLGRDLHRLLAEGDRKQLRKLTADQVFSILASLAIERHRFLEIPLGKEEVNVVPEGYINVCTGSYILLVEHEIENGEEIIHIHLVSLNHKEAGPVISLEIF